MDIGSFVAKHWGDLASVLGLGFTIWAAVNAKSAARAAREARDKIALLDTLGDVSAALEIMEEIKRLQRLHGWNIALDRYSTLCRHLLRVAQMNPGLTDSHRIELAASIDQFRTVEKKVERSLIPGSKNLNLANVNYIVSREIERIERVMIAIKQAGA